MMLVVLYPQQQSLDWEQVLYQHPQWWTTIPQQIVANEHINHTSVSITAGDGLTGGGTIASTRTLAVGQGTVFNVNANDIFMNVAGRNRFQCSICKHYGNFIALMTS